MILHLITKYKIMTSDLFGLHICLLNSETECKWPYKKLLDKIISHKHHKSVQISIPTKTVKLFNVVGTKFRGLTTMDMFVDT